MKLPPITVRIACFCQEGGTTSTGLSITRVIKGVMAGFRSDGTRGVDLNLVVLLDAHATAEPCKVSMRLIDPTGAGVDEFDLADFDPRNPRSIERGLHLDIHPRNEVPGVFTAVLLVAGEPLAGIPLQIQFSAASPFPQTGKSRPN